MGSPDPRFDASPRIQEASHATRYEGCTMYGGSEPNLLGSAEAGLENCRGRVADDTDFSTGVV